MVIEVAPGLPPKVERVPYQGGKCPGHLGGHPPRTGATGRRAEALRLSAREGHPRHANAGSEPARPSGPAEHRGGRRGAAGDQFGSWTGPDSIGPQPPVEQFRAYLLAGAPVPAAAGHHRPLQRPLPVRLHRVACAPSAWTSKASPVIASASSRWTSRRCRCSPLPARPAPGKSSILDTMLYALYGEVPRIGKHGIGEFISHGRDAMSVCLDFRISGRTTASRAG